MKKSTPTIIILAVIMGALIFLLSGCEALSQLDLPPLPDFSETAEPTQTPLITAVPKTAANAKTKSSPLPTAVATPTVSAEPTAGVRSGTSQTSAPYAASYPAAEPGTVQTVVPTVKPTVVPTVRPTAAAAQTEQSYSQVTAPTPAPVVYRSPVLSISGQTLPSDMAQFNVFTLKGIVSCDVGNISSVYGALFHGTGELAQECTYYPNSNSFSLYGTVDSDLKFAQLTPDTYIYQVIAYARNGNTNAEAILINHAFTVVPRSSGSTGSGTPIGFYTAKLSTDTDNAALIWNYFIGQFNNPYAAAAILGNIYTESSCDPTRVEGDLNGSFSKTYTASVDNGSINKDAFSGSPGGSYGYGYGLCQWSSSRKAALYDLAVARGSSVGDLTTQCEFIMQELAAEYPTLLDYLRNADDAAAAAFEFCTVYEKAAVHGGRTTYAQDYLDKYAA